MSVREHWEKVYGSKEPKELSWYRTKLERSLEWIERCALAPDAHIVDVGGGASTLVDDLLQRGKESLSVVDISSEALAHTRSRLGPAAEKVSWVVQDVSKGLPFADASVDLWHDRAVFHFLTTPAQRETYVTELTRCLRPGGYAILATFAPEGPERCSGLPVLRYSPHELAATLGTNFQLLDEANELHLTPWGSEQAFTYTLLQRR